MALREAPSPSRQARQERCPLSDRKLSFQTLTIRHASLPPIIVQPTSLALDLIEADSGLALKTALDVGMINGWEKDVATALALDLKHLIPTRCPRSISSISW